jgi:hypothetical protein
MVKKIEKTDEEDFDVNRIVVKYGKSSYVAD